MDNDRLKDIIQDAKAVIKLLEKEGDITSLDLIDNYLHNAQYRVHQQQKS